MTGDRKKTEFKRTANGLVGISGAMSSLVKSILGKKGFVIADILTVWDYIVGEEIAKYTIPSRIDFRKNEKCNGVVYIIVPGGAFALELQHNEQFVLERINSYFGYKAVSGLRIIQDANFKIKTNEFNKPKIKKSLVSLEEQNYINNLTDEIINPELKETLGRLGKSVFNQNNE